MKNIEYDLADVIIGRPHGFTVGRKHFYLYPVTLAKIFLLKRQNDELGINEAVLKANPFLEAMRLVRTERKKCCAIIAYHTAPNTYKDLFNHRAMVIRRNYFEAEIDDESLASLMIMVLNADNTATFTKELGIDEERERLRKVMAIKNKKGNNLTFGGKSIFGTFIGQLKEMGYSDDEILYEKSYTYLRLMLADKVTSVYLTDEEMQEVPSESGGNLLDASNSDNAAKVMAIFAEKGVKSLDEVDS